MGTSGTRRRAGEWVAMATLGAGLGLLAAALTQSRGSLAASAPHADAVASDAATPSVPARPAVELPPMRAPVAPTPPPAAATTGDAVIPDADVARLLAATPDTPEAAGDGMLSGQVTTADGLPLAGVDVRATLARAGSSWSSPGGPPPREPDLDESVTGAIREHRTLRSRHRGGTTDAEGRYRLDGLPPGAYRVAAWRTGFAISAVDRTLAGGAPPGAVVDFVAHDSAELRIDLRLTDGTVPPTAWLRVEGPGSGHSRYQRLENWSPTAPNLRLQAGTHALRALIGGNPGGGQDDAEWSSEARTVAIEAGKPSDPVTLTLHRRTGISARIIAPGGEQPPLAQARLLRFREGHPPSAQRLRRDGREVPFIHDGGFEVRDLAPGWWSVGIAVEHNGDIVVFRAVEVTGGVTPVELPLPPPDPASRIVVRGIGPEGQVLRDLEFALVVRRTTTTATNQRTSTRRGGVATTIESSGRCVLRLDAEGAAAVRATQAGADGVQVSLEVTSRSNGTRTMELHGPPTADLVVQFGEPATLVVTVAGYAGSPLAGRLQATLEEAGADRAAAMRDVLRGKTTSPNADGTLRLGPVGLGDYVIVLRLQEGSVGIEREAFPILRHPISLHAGAQTATLGLPVLYTVTVRTEGIAAGTRVELRQAESPDAFVRREREVGENQQVVFPDVPAGAYTLLAWTEGAPRTSFAVPAETEVRLAAETADALIVHLTDPAGGLGKAGFREGDVIIGVDGIEFSANHEMLATIAAVQEQADFRWIVLRGDARVEVTTRREVLKDAEHLGGQFLPMTRKGSGR